MFLFTSTLSISGKIVNSYKIQSSNNESISAGFNF